MQQNKQIFVFGDWNSLKDVIKIELTDLGFYQVNFSETLTKNKRKYLNDIGFA